MMFGLLLFIHLTGLSLWVGSLVAIALMLASMKKQLAADAVGTLAQRTIRTCNGIAHPSSFLVLVTGVLMLINMGMKGVGEPFWMSYMERFGGTLILLFIVVLSFIGRRVVKKLAGGSVEAAASGVTKYISSLSVSLALILSVVFVVASKL